MNIPKKNRRYKKGAIAALLFLSSCASLPKEEQRKNVLSLPSLTPSVESSLESGFFALGNWPSAEWWQLFGSEELNGLIQKSLQENPNLNGVRRRIDFAAQTAKVVRSRLFPLISFDANETWQLLSHNGLYRTLNTTIPVNANLVDLTLSFTYEFDFWGKNRHLFRAALGESKAQEAEAAQVQLITTTAVAQAYFALKTNLLRKQLYERLYQVREAIFQLDSLLQTSALLSVLPPLSAKENLLEAEKLVWGIRQEVETDKHLLNILVGNGPDTPLQIQEPLSPLPSQLEIPETVSIDLLSRRPDLMAQIWRVEALANEVGAAKADFYPNINLTGFLGLESVLYALLFKSHSKAAGLQPAIHLPIFTAGAIRANIRAKKALFDDAVEQYNSLILQSTQEVSDLLIFANSLFHQKSEQEGIVASAQVRYDVTCLRNAKGLDSLLATYALEEELIAKELDDISLLFGKYAATIKLIKSLGGGYSSDYAIPITAKEAK